MLRRAAATKVSVGKTMFILNWFIGSIRIERIHPLECGFVRVKIRTDRRPGLPIEPVWQFYPRYLTEVVTKQARWLWLVARTRKLYKQVRYGKDRYAYTDEALAPVLDDEQEGHREMFNTAEAKVFVAREKRLSQVRAGAA